jgi:hypothetical protein
VSRHPVEPAPTMIIPRGMRIEVDPEGQLSIHAPGNLVVQSSGKYNTLESLGGSIRIDRDANVEAVTVRCAETCVVQGSLTAWKVQARLLHLEDSARARVVLQETERLAIGRDARLVGNFASEKEMIGLFSRFTRQLRSLPSLLERKGSPAELTAGSREIRLDETLVLEGRVHDEEPGPPPEARAEEAPRAAPPESAPEPPPASPAELPEPLLFALVLLEQESERGLHPPGPQRNLQGLIQLLQEQDLETLRLTWRTLFGRVVDPGQDVRRAHELVAGYFEAADESG